MNMNPGGVLAISDNEGLSLWVSYVLLLFCLRQVRLHLVKQPAEKIELRNDWVQKHAP